MNLVMYSTDCPKCIELKRKLTEKNLAFAECKDISVMRGLNIQSVPVLSVDGKLMDFVQAIRFVNTLDAETET